MHFFNPAPAMKLVEVVRTVLTGRRGRTPPSARCARQITQAPGGLRRPRGIHRERAAVPVPQQRDQDGRGALRLARRHRRGDEARRRLSDGALRAARRRRAGRLAGHREGAAPRVPRPGPGARRRCWSTWWPRAASAARPAAASASMPGAEAGASRGGGACGRARWCASSPRGGDAQCTGCTGTLGGAGCSSLRETARPPSPSRRVSVPPHARRPLSPRRSRSRAAAQRLKMRRELAAAAMELFATKGYEATTVDEIAATAGVARRTFFRHFRSKEEAIFPDHDDTLVRARGGAGRRTRARAPARHGVPRHQGSHADVRGVARGLASSATS